MTTQKNIVICLDGTGNQIEENLSNVLKLYRVLKKDSKQVVFYDQGVGTLKKVTTWGHLLQKMQRLSGLAIGYGLDQNVLQAYQFIVTHFSQHKGEDAKTISDKIYIIGFSRGAHAARVLAGLIYEIGILRPEQVHLSNAALMAYKQSTSPSSASDDSTPQSENSGISFRRIIGSRTAPIEFLGIFDTVSAVFVNNANGLWPPFVRENLPHTDRNPAVRCVRHAMAADECRRMFRVDRWQKEQQFKPNRHSQGAAVMQDVEERWFSGCHTDVGGGEKRNDSGLSQFPLIWMIDAATTAGLAINQRMALYVSGQKPYTSNTKYLYPKPASNAKAHDSMTPVWKFLERLPKRVRYRESEQRHSRLGFYIPLAEPRPFMAGDAVDSSVDERKHEVAGYEPASLPIQSEQT